MDTDNWNAGLQFRTIRTNHPHAAAGIFLVWVFVYLAAFLGARYSTRGVAFLVPNIYA